MTNAGGIESLISTVGTTKILAHFNLNQSYYGMVYAALLNALSIVMDRKQLEGISFWYIFLTLIVGLVGYLFAIGRLSVAELVDLPKTCSNLWSQMILNFRSQNKMNIKLTNRLVIHGFFDYLMKGIEKKDILILDKNFDIEHAVQGSYLSESRLYRFKDNNFDYVMTIELRSNSSKSDPNSNPNSGQDQSGYFLDGKHLIVGLDKFVYNNRKHIDKCISFYDVKDNQISLYYVQSSNGISGNSGNLNSDTKMIIYKGRKYEDQTGAVVMYNRYIKTYFHNKIDQIWKVVESVQFTPDSMREMGQNPQLTLCLHGPPGTGKSTLAYRIAMATGRHILNIDLKTIKYKETLRNILSYPKISSTTRETKDVVFIVDEFDLAIKFLKQKQDFINLHKMRSIENISNSIYKMSYYQPEIKNNQPVTPENQPVTQENQPVTQENQSQNNQQTALNKSKNLSPISEICGVFDEISSLLTINDLLEIIQGPVPYDGLIFIVTTNHFEEIYKLCPALFRDGRFAPVYCGPVTKEMLVKIVEFYFKSSMPSDYEVHDLTMPAATVVNLAIKHNLLKNSVDLFLKDLH